MKQLSTIRNNVGDTGQFAQQSNKFLSTLEDPKAFLRFST